MNEHQKQIDSGSSSDVKKNGSRKKFFILLSACILLCAAVILIISQQKKAGVSEGCHHELGSKTSGHKTGAGRLVLL